MGYGDDRADWGHRVGLAASALGGATVVQLASSLLADAIKLNAPAWSGWLGWLLMRETPAWANLVAFALVWGLAQWAFAARAARPVAVGRGDPLSMIHDEARRREREGALLRRVADRLAPHLRAVAATPGDNQAEALREYCRTGREFLAVTEATFFPLLQEAADRMQAAFVASGKGGARAFDAAFAAGQQFRPWAVRGRSQVAYYAGMQSQFMLDLAAMARLAVELPLALEAEARRSPGRGLPDLWDDWFDRAKLEATERVADEWAGVRAPWAATVIDDLIATADQEPDSPPPESSLS